MATRRMFSKEIIETDQFIELPHSAQCLYIHLCMKADDDGFIASASTTVREICASDADLKLLVENEYLFFFPKRKVYVIKAYLMQNSIRPDRYHPTIYQDEKAQLTLTEEKLYVLKQADSHSHTSHSKNFSQEQTNRHQSSNHPSSNPQPIGNQVHDSCQPNDPRDQSSPGKCSINDDDDISTDEVEIVEIFQQEIGRKPMPGELSKIISYSTTMGFGPGVAEFAIELAAGHGAKNVTAYIKKVLEKWNQHGLKTLDSVEAAYISGELKQETRTKNYDLPE